MLNAKVLNKKIATTEEGIFYKEVVSDKGNVVDKVYLLRYRENFMDKQITIGREKSGFNLKMCKAKRIVILSKIQNGEYTGKKYKITFGEVFDKYIEHAKGNKKTWKQDENAFEFHLKGLKKFDLRHLKSEIFETLKQKKLADGYKPRTVQYILGLARQVINHAITYDMITNYTNPISKNKVKMPPYDNKQVGF
ncbi:MAG: hypothetical protein U9N33_08300 [Campylobacterota bacterium]|nr:hypothetical protein [Campylobacterota bacterium]